MVLFRLAWLLFAFAGSHGVVAGQPLATRSVGSTSELHAAMDDSSVDDIVMAAGVYRLACLRLTAKTAHFQK
jgi:hypothetical protein